MCASRPFPSEVGLIASKTRQKRVDSTVSLNLCSSGTKDTRPKRLIQTALDKGGQHEKTSSVFSNCARPFFQIALALGAMMLVPVAGARTQDAQEGPIEIEKCRTIDKPGSYTLVNNLTFTSFTAVPACQSPSVSSRLTSPVSRSAGPGEDHFLTRP
jgi:hypothetical protein